MYVVRGILRLTSPLHIAAPRKETVDPETDRLLPGGERGIMVVPTTKYRLPMFVRGSQTSGVDAIAEAEVPRGSAFADVPVIPANDPRGRLRRCAARKVFDVLLARNEQTSLGAYHGMTCGAVTGSPNGRLTFAEAAQAARHSFLGLFGGGPSADFMLIERVAGKNHSRQPAASIFWRTASFLWTLKLSKTTTWPGRRAGQSTFSR